MGTIVSFNYNYIQVISYDIYKRGVYLLSILGFFPKFSFSNLSECLSKKNAALILLSGTNFADAREDFVFSKGDKLYFGTEMAKCNKQQRNHKMVLNTL